MAKPETIEEVLTLLESRPEDAELFQILGRLYIRGYQFEKSREAYERSLALNPDDPWTHLYMGNWCYHLGKWKEALRWFERAAELLPDEAISYTCLGDVYKKLGRYDEAEQAYRKATRIAPDDNRARRKLAEWYEFRYGEPQE